MSDHCAIAWRVAKQRELENRPPKKNKFTGWTASFFDAGAMRVFMEGGYAEESSAEEKVEDVMCKVTSACDAAMPRRGNGNPHKPVYWWSDRIAQLRAECHKARRLSQRARGKPTFPELEEKFKLARSKRTELHGVVDEDPWGRPYKVVMARLMSQSRQQPTCPEQLEKIVSTLFPEQEPFEREPNTSI